MSAIVHDEPESMTSADMRLDLGLGSDVARDADFTLAARSPARPELHSVPLELEAEYLTLSAEMQCFIRSRLSKHAVPVETPISDSGDISMAKLDISDTRGAGGTLTSFPIS